MFVHHEVWSLYWWYVIPHKRSDETSISQIPDVFVWVSVCGIKCHAIEVSLYYQVRLLVISCTRALRPSDCYWIKSTIYMGGGGNACIYVMYIYRYILYMWACHSASLKGYYFQITPYYIFCYFVKWWSKCLPGKECKTSLFLIEILIGISYFLQPARANWITLSAFTVTIRRSMQC